MTDKIYTTVPDGLGECPVCEGTGQKDGEKCRNCGWQYMFGKPCGLTRLNKNGVPCAHSYVGQNIGRCLTSYYCKECGDTYSVDSGD